MRAKHRLVVLDVDSTLVTIEGIDVLAGGNPEIATLTRRAMDGETALEEVYARRLEIIRPSRSAVDALAARYLQSLVAGAEETIDRLRDAGAVVHLVTAGIEQAVQPLADKLGTSLHAVRLQFTKQGEYAGFEKSPLTKSGGKETVILDIRARTHGSAALIGDGASDLEAKPAVDLFIGFGGVHIRPRVRDNADVFVTDFAAMAPYLIE